MVTSGDMQGWEVDIFKRQLGTGPGRGWIFYSASLNSEFFVNSTNICRAPIILQAVC